MPLSRALLPANWTERSAGTRVIGLASVESGFLVQVSPSPPSFAQFDDIGALLVLCALLDGMEMSFWKEVRGRGLSYSYDLSIQIETGVVAFMLFKSTSLLKALRVSEQIVREYADGTRTFDRLSVEAARSSVVFGIFNGEATPQKAGLQAFIETLKDAPDSTTHLLAAVAKADAEALARAMSAYLLPLFGDNVPRVVCINSAKAAEVAQELGCAVQNIDDFTDETSVF